MPELKIKCRDPELLKSMIENMKFDRIKSLKSGISQTKKRLLEFEEKYQLPTQEFLLRYENDEFEETLELDEWIGEALMLKRLEEKIEKLGDIEFVI